MRDYLEIGSSPTDEPCVQVGEEDYATRAKAECRAYIEAIRKKLGEEPWGADLAIKGFDHDFGRYYEVVCYYDYLITEAVEYAFRCESDGPVTWAEVGMTAPTLAAA